MIKQAYVLMENAKTHGKERRKNDKPIKVSLSYIDLDKEILNTKEYWYAVHLLEIEDEPAEMIELGDPNE